MEPQVREEPPRPEGEETVESALENAFKSYCDVWRDLQKRKPELFDPPTHAAYEEARASLPWPLNQKDAELFLAPPGHINAGVRMSWEEADGTLMRLYLGYTHLNGRRRVYYERMQGDSMYSYSEGHLAEFTAGTLPKEIPMRAITAEEWSKSKDAVRLSAILDGLKQYPASLPPGSET